MNRKLVWLLQLDSSKSVSGILGVVHIVSSYSELRELLIFNCKYKDLL